MTEEWWSCWACWQSVTKKDQETWPPLGESAESRGRGFWLHCFNDAAQCRWDQWCLVGMCEFSHPQQLSTWQPPASSRSLAWQSGRHKSPRPGTTVRSACRVKAPQLSEDPLSQLAHWSGSVQAWLSLSLHVFSQWILHFLHLCFSRLLSMKMKRRVTCICLFLGQWW